MGCLAQVREIYRLLVDSSAPIRHAAAELVAGMLEEQGQRFIAQACVQSFQDHHAHAKHCTTQECHMQQSRTSELNGLVSKLRMVLKIKNPSANSSLKIIE